MENRGKKQNPDCRRGILSFSRFTAPQAACMEMQISLARPLAFYRINLRPIRRTTIFNGSSHNRLLSAVKGQRNFVTDKSAVAFAAFFLPGVSFTTIEMSHCCVTVFPLRTFAGHVSPALSFTSMKLFSACSVSCRSNAWPCSKFNPSSGLPRLLPKAIFSSFVPPLF